VRYCGGLRDSTPGGGESAAPDISSRRKGDAVHKENTGPRPRQIQYELRLVRDADGKAIAGGGGETSAMTLRPDWGGYKLSFRPLAVAPGGSSEFHASELLKADGVYRIELSLDGKPYGVYRVAVKGGKFRRDAADARAAEGALMPLENDANYWSLQRAAR